MRCGLMQVPATAATLERGHAAINMEERAAAQCACLTET